MPKVNKLRKFIAVALTAAIALTLAACAGASFTYDKNAAVKKAEETVDMVNKRDYQAVFNIMTADMQKLLPAEKLQNSLDPILDASGKFAAYVNAQTSGVTTNGVDYIVVVVSAKYEKTTRIFTISLTSKDMLIGGLYMK